MRIRCLGEGRKATTNDADWQTRIGAMKFPNCTAGPRGEVTGKVTKAGGAPIAGATVRIGGSRTVTDDQSGYKLTLPTGQHEVTASAFGYASKSATVTVPDGGAVTENFALDPVPLRKVSGVVKDGSGHGWPLYSRIEELVEAGEPRIVAGQDNDGCVVFAISPRFSAALARDERSRLRDVAASWAQLRAEDGEVIDTEIADAIVGDLADLACSA
ncbi:carboxypeptidase regulatory-like domain-containing protein [Streptomyces sp. NBC_00873]|uniref:carboxypeptidase regulatory-like domain-containing protein n=1 Tax=unclassified Streptomyces TaxID=2593676 RepID=UPI0038701D13|nr:carboxypeptidase regulatory-like domain-containing protein [Streptomyces sp. NBC_00873]WTA41691.1 carboxypeptidase regulatory-like domain-containing protein [Streptomyces sp. NBC_00842]